MDVTIDYEKQNDERSLEEYRREKKYKKAMFSEMQKYKYDVKKR